MAQAISAKEAAIMLDVDAKTFRRFVRSYVKGNGGTVGTDTPGRGGRYTFDADDMPAIEAAFGAWRSGAGSMLIRFDAVNVKEADETDA